jgi:predicted GNAT family acetyltransferase
MGRYIGIRDTASGQLAAMAGIRLQVDRFAEISAVCTHPNYRGRGYAGGLVRILTQYLRSAGRTAFLHVIAENPAVKVYERAGFAWRKSLYLTVIARPVDHT